MEMVSNNEPEHVDLDINNNYIESESDKIVEIYYENTDQYNCFTNPADYADHQLS